MNNCQYNLRQYIKEDETYQQYKNKKNLDNFSDFDWFCINHCEDIENMLQNEEFLYKELTLSTKKLLEIKQYCINRQVIDKENCNAYEFILSIIDRKDK